MSAERIDILLVEDDPGDIMIIREAFDEHKIRHRITVVCDGADALALLRQEGGHVDAARPDLILLDLNLPRMNGSEVLEAIKTDPALATIPVVVLSTSQADEDVTRSYELHANAYIAKPVDFEGFREIVRRINGFFIGVVKLPPPPSGYDA